MAAVFPWPIIILLWMRNSLLSWPDVFASLDTSSQGTHGFFADATQVICVALLFELRDMCCYAPLMIKNGFFPFRAPLTWINLTWEHLSYSNLCPRKIILFALLIVLAALPTSRVKIVAALPTSCIKIVVSLPFDYHYYLINHNIASSLYHTLSPWSSS